MCGIAGLFLPQGATSAIADLEAMAAAMAHRGPDGEGFFVSPDRRYQAAFVRLSIIDLETGDQPIVEDNGARVLMGNGEIYNYVELRASEPGYPYRTNGDMEVALALSARHGDAFTGALNGMYALALWERDADRLLLVRDRLGVKPLYWARLAGGGVLFASEIKAWFASGLIAPAIDEAAVSAYLAHGYVPAPATLFAGIRKLPPGHVLDAHGDGRLTVEPYWRARPAPDFPSDADEAAECLSDLLRDSVRLQLRSDVAVGALLSGGIDSGLLVALAASQSGRPLDTFTVRFEGSSVDESPLAARVAQDAARLQRDGDNAEAAARRARIRVFGSKPGAYGAGLQALIDERGWESEADLAHAYLAWGGYAYGAGLEGAAEHRLFERRLGAVQAVLQNQDNREHDLLDSDDYYQFEGGITAAVRVISGQQPTVYHNDHSRPESPKIRTLEDEIARVVRARVVNPKWIAGVKRHGYKGAFEMAATVDYLFAFAATARAVGDHHFDAVYDAYLGDPETRSFLEENNPDAAREIAERLIEAQERGLWRPRRNTTREELEKLVLGRGK